MKRHRDFQMMQLVCLTLSAVVCLVVVSLRANNLVNGSSEDFIRGGKKENLFNNINISVENFTEYQKYNLLLEHGFSSSRIEKAFGSESLNKMCRNLPGENMFMDSEIGHLKKLPRNNLFHLVLLYSELSAKHMCVVEGLISMINADARRTNVKLIIWISPDGVQIKKQDKRMLSDTINRAQFKVEFKFVDSAMMFQNTPLEGFYNCMERLNLDLGTHKNQNVGNAVRLAILYKYGGFYLDWDFLVADNLLDLPQGLGYQDEKHDFLNNAAMKFKKGSRILNEIILEFIRDYDGNIWAHNGPQCLRRTFNKTACFAKEPSKIDHYCIINGQPEDIKFWEYPKFYPFFYYNSKLTLIPVTQVNATMFENASLIHLWNHILAPFERSVCIKNQTQYRISTVGRLRQKYCPISLEAVIDNGKCDF